MKEELLELGAAITSREIYQQPEVWQESFQNYLAQKDQIDAFLEDLNQRYDSIQVIFTGAGTSAYVGDTLLPSLISEYDQKKWNFRSIATTDLVAHPEIYLQEDLPTLLVSFARSGNSPESLAAVELAKHRVKDLYQLTITCAAEGKLAQAAQGDERNLLLLQPAKSNDAGFAMTSSFTSMMLTALLVFDARTLEAKEELLKSVVANSQQLLDEAKKIEEVLAGDFDRVIYLGAGPFFGLAHEAQLKILELTAGRLATQYESPVGFRHGPKSFIDDKTLLVVFGSSFPYTKLYDLDLIREVAADGIAHKILYLTNQEEDLPGVNQIVLDHALDQDAYLAFPYIVYGQLLALFAALKVGNKPDTPSPTGTVNRVVQGVVIHPFP